MKKILMLILTTISLTALAEDQPRHMITVGSDTFGFDSYSSKTDLSGGHELLSTLGELKLNYAYTLNRLLQIGASLSSTSDESETRLKSGAKITEESDSSILSIFAVINFSEDIRKSFYLKMDFARGTLETDYKDKTDPSENYSTESDISGYSISFGKRFSLSSIFDTEVITYSPDISYGQAYYSGDAKTAGLRRTKAVSLVPIKFDLLF